MSATKTKKTKTSKTPESQNSGSAKFVRDSAMNGVGPWGGRLRPLCGRPRPRNRPISRYPPGTSSSARSVHNGTADRFDHVQRARSAPGTRTAPSHWLGEVASSAASSQPHGTTAYAGSWDQGGESKRPAVRVPRIDHGVDRFFTAPQRREGGPGHPCWRGRPERRTARGQRRRERGWGRVLLAGAVGGGSAASSAGLSLGRYDSPSMTKS